MQLRRVLRFGLAVSAVWLSCFASDGVSAPVMVEKNLFAQDRKPPSPESVAQPAQPAKPGLTPKAFQLDGVFIRGNTRKAIVRVKGQLPGADKSKPQNPYVTVSEGEKLGDFQVIKIEPRSISLEKDGQTEVVSLFAEGKVVIPPPPVPAAPLPPAALGVPPAPPQPGQPPVDAARGQPPTAGQPPQPMPPGQMGGQPPGVVQPPRMANQPPGRHLAPPPEQTQHDLNTEPEDEGDLEEEEPAS